MENRQVIEWDKNDIEILKFMKADVLGLGMLGCMRRTFQLLRKHRGLHLDLASIPSEDSKTFAMIRQADMVGVFQIYRTCIERGPKGLAAARKGCIVFATVADGICSMTIQGPLTMQEDLISEPREGRLTKLC
jgi:hypothetical protein